MTTSALAFQPRSAPSDMKQRRTRSRHAPEPREPVPLDEFVAAMRGAATGVNIVTTDGPAGRLGLTVSAFASVSAEPPLLLVCINRRSPACAAVHANRRFCVNVLSDAQRPVADTFAGRSAAGEAYEFGAAIWRTSARGLPILNDVSASFECSLTTSVDVGTHTIFIGSVDSAEATDNSPLIYTDGTYRRTGSKA